jgi:hypothetical protein
VSIAWIIGIGVVLLIIVIAAVQRSGPRVTQIDRTVRREKDEDDA